jgi:histidinol-phosphate phosphatase family protein
MRQAVILAGGQGTRLRERLGDLPKPLIDLCGVPLLERQILLLKQYGFDDILILVNYKGEKIVEFCNSKNNWGLAVKCIDDGLPCGTAGAVLRAWDQLSDEFLVVYGDTMFEVDLDRFKQFHQQVPITAATLFLHPNDHPHDSDLVEMDDAGIVTGFYPYPHDGVLYLPNLVNAALYIVRKATLESWRFFSEETLDFGKHVFPKMIGSGLLLRGYSSPEYIKDCGTPQRIDKVSADFRSGKIHRASLSHPQAAVFLDRDGTINVEVDHLISQDHFELIPGVVTAIQRLNRSEFRTCVVTNQPVIARGECTPAQLRSIHNKMETLLGQKGAFVDRIDYCPHHPDRGFIGEVPELKFLCTCRKPETGMIDRAIKKLNIDTAKSWMVGDTTTDVQLAKKAGIKSILVETGYAGLDHKYLVNPDFTAPDLQAAVNFILDTYPHAMEVARDLTQNVKAGDCIFVGGQARSGKSSFSSLFKFALAERGITAHTISTDRWLRSESERAPGLHGRHDMTSLRTLVTSLQAESRKALVIKLPVYRKKDRTHILVAENILMNHSDVVIFEGVVALVFAVNEKKRNKFYIHIEEALRKERFLNEYKIRGCSLQVAQDLYARRLKDEYPCIKQMAIDAQVITTQFMCKQV